MNTLIRTWRSGLSGLFCWMFFLACTSTGNPAADAQPDAAVVQPDLVTEVIPHDTDDPAFWIDSARPSRSLVIGTDKDEQGGLFVFDLQGRIDTARTVKGLKRPNNVDVEYGLWLGGKRVDIAVTTERLSHKLRVFTVPDMKQIDGGGIPVFEGETGEGFRDLMGVALYKNPQGVIYVMVGRKSGPTDGTYIWQYRLEDDGRGIVRAVLVRKFGAYSGKHEIEAIMADDAMGYVYYSDEGVGVRKYYADAEKGNEELALFATTDFVSDHEGISLYSATDSTGYILVSDQQGGRFQIFTREGTTVNSHDHRRVRTVKVAAHESDGSEITSVNLGPSFPRGLFVAMSDNRTFHYYRAEKILGDSLLNPVKSPNPPQ